MRQHEFFEPKQDFGSPSKDRAEPLFWIKELRFLKRLSAAKDAEVRRIPFRKGLNIVWAEATPNEQRDDKQRVVGHAAGKSTLCRFIRFALGERHYADGDVSNAIAEEFRDGYIVAEVVLPDARWVVSRPVSGVNPARCRCDCSIDEYLAEPEKRERFAVYETALGKLRKSITPINELPDGSGLGFWHVLPWMTRDQDCYFAELDVWRNNPVSCSDSPFLSKEKAMLVMRSVLAPDVAEEIPLVQKQTRLADGKKQIESKQHDADVLFTEYREGLKPLAKAKSCDMELIESSLDRFEKEIEDTLDSDGVTEEDEALLQSMEAACETLERTCAVAKDQIEGSEEAYHHALRKIRELKKTAISKDAESEIQEAAREHPGRKYCCVPIEVAKLECRIYLQAKADLESQKHLFEAAEPETVEKLEQSAKVHFEVLERERIRWRQSMADLAEAVAKRDNWRRELRNRRRRHARRSAENGVHLEIIKRYKAARTLQTTLATSYAKTQKQHDDCTKSLSKERVVNKPKFERFVEVYDQMIGFVLGSKIRGKVTLSGGDISLACTYKGNLTSAAIRSVQTVCFDFAVLVLSIEGSGTHPRFLLHDSPRVADLSADIFHQYFWLARKLEDLSGGTPNFQYIITTTEPPPKELIGEDDPWVVCKLDARTAEHRLLKLDL